MAAGSCQRLAAAEQTGAEPFADAYGIAQTMFPVCPTATISSAGDSRGQHGFGAGRHCCDADFFRERELLGRRPELRIQLEMNMGINQPGHDHSALEIDARHLRIDRPRRLAHSRDSALPYV